MVAQEEAGKLKDAIIYFERNAWLLKKLWGKLSDYAAHCFVAAFDLAQKLVRAEDVNEVLALQSEFARAQMAAMQTQAKELGAVAQDAIASATRK